MSNIYEQKARKYKYKYLKLKQELEGGGGMFGKSKSEEDIILKITNELFSLITDIEKINNRYIKICKGDKGFVSGSLKTNDIYCHLNMLSIKENIMDNSNKTKNKYPEIVTYFFNNKEKWRIDGVYGREKDEPYRDAYFDYADLQKLKNKFHNTKYPYYTELIEKLGYDPTLAITVPIKQTYEQFYKKYIAPYVKNLDIYVIVMFINDLFTRYKNKLTDNKYIAAFQLVDKLVKDAQNNRINSPDLLLQEIAQISKSIQPE
jgi:hypothetical protein